MNAGSCKTIFKTVCATIVAASLMACVHDPQVGADSELTASPVERDLTITEFRDPQGRCLFDEQFYQDMPLQFVLKSASGSPIGGSEVSVYVDFSGNTFSGNQHLGLYADSNGNGVIDTPDELVSGADDAIYRVKTERYSGSVDLLLRINLSCAFDGRVFAFSGPVSTTVKVSVTAVQVVP